MRRKQSSRSKQPASRGNDEGRRRIASILRKHRTGPRRRFGQNFLVDEDVVSESVEAAEVEICDMVIEIGPGLGILTRPLLERAGLVVAIELDRDLCSILTEELASFRNLRLINADFLRFDLKQLIKEGDEQFESVKVVANLPYNLTSPIISRLIDLRTSLKSAVMMLQREVAERLSATPGGKDYGSLTVSVQMYADVSHVANVPPESFYPMPKVQSSILRMDFLDAPRCQTDDGCFERVVKAAFSHRRKTLRNSLASLADVGVEDSEELLHRAGIDPTRRAETLSISEYARLAQEYGDWQREKEVGLSGLHQPD